MKKTLTATIKTTFKKDFKQLLAAAVLFLTLFLPGRLPAQADSSKKEAPAVKEAPSIISPSVEFVSVQNGNNTIDLKAALKAKVNGSFIKLPLLKVSFVQVTDEAGKALGFVITDRNGKAVFHTKADSLITGKDGKLHFKALFAGNKSMDPAEGEVTIKRARLEITPVKDDSLLSVNIKLLEIGAGTETPVPKITLGVFVTRLFNPLKVGEGTTGTNGEATVEIPGNLPGDVSGNITLLAKLDENETYGNLEASLVQKWGVPVSNKLKEQPRALWSSHPPVWMLVTFIILMATVWGHYFVIIFQLFRLRKEEPEPNSPNIETIA